jgi:hypothetical protein
MSKAASIMDPFCASCSVASEKIRKKGRKKHVHLEKIEMLWSGNI